MKIKKNVEKVEKSTKKVLNEFKTFALKGNIIDMAVGVIIGGAFGKIVTSMVNDIIMPLISLVTGKKTDFSNFFIALDGGTYDTIDAAKTAGASTLNYGIFITSIIDFLIIAFSIFMVIKQLSNLQNTVAKLQKKEEAEKPPPVPTTKECTYCKSVIHIDAVKCPSCTSDLADADVQTND